MIPETFDFAFAFDLLLALSLLVVAWRVMDAPRLLEAILLFIAFGLLMALSWMRLGAPDVALAEAAIGTGVTGALLLSTLARLRHLAEEQGEDA